VMVSLFRKGFISVI